MKKIYNKEFSLIELLCIIVILGILITMGIIITTQVINSNKENSLSFREKTLITIGKKYVKENKDKLPKYIGESININLFELNLNKNIVDKKCINKSYIRIYKYDDNKYSYLPVVSCNNKEDIPSPTVNILFIDGNKKLNNNLIFNNMNEARLYIEISGGLTEGGNKIEIDDYEISISMKTIDNPNLVEYYNSSLIDDSKSELIIDKKLTDYIDFSNATYISVRVKAINIVGGVKEVVNTVETNS